jgi:hypothetical protein
MKRASIYVPAALLIFVLGFVAILFWGNAFAQDAGKGDAAAPSKKWEYKVRLTEAPDDKNGISTEGMEKTLNDSVKTGGIALER